MRLRRSPNGKRYGVRNKAGRITFAYGFDMSPLAERMGEFVAAAAEWEARRDEGKRLRREIGSLYGAVRSLVELAIAEGAVGQDWPTFATQANVLFEQRGRDRDPLSLLPIVARLRALHVRVQEAVAAAIVVPVDHGNSDPLGPEYRPHNTTTNHLPIVNTIANAAEARGQEGKSKDRQPSSCATASAVRESGYDNALRGFVATPAFVLAVAPMFEAPAGGSHAGWADLARAALHVCRELGVSQHAWGQACVMLGQQAAVLALASIAARHARGLVQSPGGLLRHMVELHEAGTLRLDRTLFGLANELTRQRVATGKPPEPPVAFPGS